MSDYALPRWRKVPLEKLKTPRGGAICYTDTWWIVTPDNCVLFFRGFSPQCNSNEAVAKYLRERLHPTCTVEKIEVAYLDHNCHDYM